MKTLRKFSRRWGGTSTAVTIAWSLRILNVGSTGPADVEVGGEEEDAAMKKICRIDGCNRRVSAKGFCKTHYNRQRANHPKKNGPIRTGAPVFSFFTQLLYQKQGDLVGSCITWPHAKNGKGYGVVKVPNNQGGWCKKRVHRLVLEFKNPPPAPGMHAAHLCGVSSCVNRAHLRWKTPAENSGDMIKHNTVKHNTVSGKLKIADVYEVRSMIASGDSTKVIAKKFHVGRWTINNIKSGRTWSRLPAKTTNETGGRP
jgi:hypothetical protein